MDDRDKDPAVVLPYLVGRPLAGEGRVVTADNLIRAAKHFGLNPIDLQVRFGLIPPEAVTEYAASKRSRPRLRDLHPDPSKPPV